MIPIPIHCWTCGSKRYFDANPYIGHKRFYCSPQCKAKIEEDLLLNGIIHKQGHCIHCGKMTDSTFCGDGLTSKCRYEVIASLIRAMAPHGIAYIRSYEEYCQSFSYCRK